MTTPEEVPLTPAAEATLGEFLSDHRNRILNEAVRLSPGEVLTPRDIVNAHDALEARQTAGWNPRSSLLREATSERQSLRLSRNLLLVVAAISGLALFLLQTLDLATPTVMWVFIGGVAALLAAGIALFAFSYFERRRAAFSLENEILFEEITGAHDGAVRSKNLLAAERVLSADEPTTNEEFVQRAKFLNHWLRLEERLRSLAYEALGMEFEDVKDYPIGPLLNELTHRNIINDRIGNDIRSLLKVRNDVVHLRRVNLSEVRDAIDEMQQLEEYLDLYIEEHKVY